MTNILILMIAIALTSCAEMVRQYPAAQPYSTWKAGLAGEAKRFASADDDYWRQWWKRGFSVVGYFETGLENNK